MTGSRPRLTPADVEAKRFKATMFREGYDQRDIDALLDRVAATLGEHAPEPLRSEDVAQSARHRVRRTAGYDIDEVDDFLRLVSEELRRRESELPGAPPAHPPAARRAEVPGGLSAATVEATRFTATKFRRGYDQGEVDTFLDRVVATLQGATRERPLSADEAARTTFTVVRNREGYHRAQVDALRALIVAELRRRGAR